MRYFLVLNAFNRTDLLDVFIVRQGASTGELIISQLGRIAGRSMADAFFERITLFPVEGDPIANDDCLPEIDTDRYPSLDQFGVICGFLSDMKLQLDETSDVELAELTFQMKKSCEYAVDGLLKDFVYYDCYYMSKGGKPT